MVNIGHMDSEITIGTYFNDQQDTYLDDEGIYKPDEMSIDQLIWIES